MTDVAETTTTPTRSSPLRVGSTLAMGLTAGFGLGVVARALDALDLRGTRVHLVRSGAESVLVLIVTATTWLGSQRAV